MVCKSKKNFIKKLDQSLTLIKANPEYFQKSELVKGLHRCVITKHITLYYRYDDSNIYVVTFFDNRQNLGRLKTILINKSIRLRKIILDENERNPPISRKYKGNSGASL